MNDIPIADWPDVFGQCFLFALVVGCVVAAVRAIKSALDAETSAANQAEWTKDLPTCGLCGAHRLLTKGTYWERIDGDNSCGRTLELCSDCIDRITIHEQERAA